MPRLRPPSHPVTVRFDGERVVAERGEPAAVALIAAGHLALARSPKFHRPRGPACLRAACDGCLARVDDVPNVMTCRVPCADGMRIETQNVVGSKDTDLLRVTDWFFPEGMNHHELFAGVPGVERIMQGFARRVAGLGRLPTADRPRGAEAIGRREVDALVIGAGPAGLSAATELARRGRDVEVVDDDLAWGGCARFFSGSGTWALLTATFAEAVASSRIRVRLRTTAAGIYGDDVLLARDGEPPDGSAGSPRVEVVHTRTLVLAPGAHDGVLAFEGNDVPGVMAARAACRLLTHGVVAGERVVVAVVQGGGPYGAMYAAAHSGATLVHGVPVRVTGSGRVKAATVSTPAGERRFPCDALLVDAPRVPAYELCAQAGADLSHQPRGFVARVGPGGRVRDGVFAVGEVVGTPLEREEIGQEAQAMGEASARSAPNR
jgi:sarcosine oxidase subunit alpha